MTIGAGGPVDDRLHDFVAPDDIAADGDIALSIEVDSAADVGGRWGTAGFGRWGGFWRRIVGHDSRAWFQ